ncbi:MAG: hypothetical protein ACRDI2_16665 [Chloroflexota bacterium]
MTETVTLELPDEVAHRARAAAHRTGRRLEDVLTEWLDRAAAAEDSALLPPNVEHHIFTPYGNDAAARILLEVLKSAEATDRKVDQGS